MDILEIPSSEVFQEGAPTKMRKLGWLILLTGTMAASGGAGSQTAAPKASLASPPSQPLVFYDPAGEPSGWATALSEIELREITGWVRTQTTDPIWLIRVKPSLYASGRGHIIAYLTPDEMTPRIRTGRAYNIPRDKELAGTQTPWRYVRVSAPDCHFTERFVRPPLPELPFEWPGIVDPNGEKIAAMSKEETTAVVDFLHQPSSYHELVIHRGVSLGVVLRGVFQSPIYRIERRGNEIDVKFGFMHDFLWGHGLFVTLEHSLIGYRIKTWGSWIS